MTKVHVLPGVWWIDIPDADIRILCGTPMDSIKHLMRRGLVKSVEKQGVGYETGPNVILLSDVPVQNGSFWNMAEFPVLHMLYRQGMGIPGHPGNTGKRPILAGLRERAEAVLRYIYRGTYGLASREELIAEGIDGELLEELWKLKLKFASGKIMPPEELVEIAAVENDEFKLPGGVSVARIGLNQYQISHQGESVEVDMNLPEGENWVPSYTLNQLEVEDGYFSVIHIGEGNGWDPDRPCMGSIVSYRGKRFLIDAGPGIGYSLEALGIDVAEIDGLFMTHAHDDHFSGLTSLIRGDWKVQIYATRPVYATVRYKAAALLETSPEFLDNLVDVHYLECDVWNNVDGLEVRPIISPHPLETTVLFFRTLWEGGYKSYAHLADIVSRRVLEGFVGEDGISQKFFNKVMSDYYRVADVKKIDAGRGMIHGMAEDFIDDESPRLIISHMEGEPSQREKEIGATTSFGQVDILIPDRGHRLRDTAALLLKKSEPFFSDEDFSLLLNGRVKHIPPGTPLNKRGVIPDSLLLVISGTVEHISSDTGVISRYTAGSLIGEAEVLNSCSTEGSYRTRNYTKALRLPADLYIHALNRSKQVDKRRQLLDKRCLLLNGSFPGHVVSCPRLDMLAESITEFEVKKGHIVKPAPNECYIAVRGELTAGSGKSSCTFGPGDWINPGVAANKNWKAVSDLTLAVISGSVVNDIPILSWVLSEL